MEIGGDFVEILWRFCGDSVEAVAGAVAVAGRHGQRQAEAVAGGQASTARRGGCTGGGRAEIETGSQHYAAISLLKPGGQTCTCRSRVLYRTSMTKSSSSCRGQERFLNQDPVSSSNRRKRRMMSTMRAKRRGVLKRPAESRPAESKRPAWRVGFARRPVPDPGNRHRVYPCCGYRRQRCRCDWTAVEKRLNSTAWKEFVSRVEKAELKYVGASMLVLSFWFVAFFGFCVLGWHRVAGWVVRCASGWWTVARRRWWAERVSCVVDFSPPSPSRAERPAACPRD